MSVHSTFRRALCRVRRQFAPSLTRLAAVITLVAAPLAAQAPTSITVTPAANTHVTSAALTIAVTACGTNQLNATQFVTVNGVGYTAIAGGTGPRGCGRSQAGAWVANVTLTPGENDISAEVCDVVGNCAFGSTTIFYDATYSILVTANTSPLTMQELTGGTASFTIANNGPTNGTAHIVVSCVGMSGTCSGSKDTTLSAGGSMSVIPVFTTGSTPTTGSVTVTASYLEATSVSSAASTSVTIQPPPPAIAVTLDSAAQVTVGPGSRTLFYTVSNTGGVDYDVSITAACGVFGGCTPLINNALILGTVHLPSGVSQDVTIQLSVTTAQQGDLNVPVTLTASGPVTGAASYSVSYPAPVFAIAVTANTPPITTHVSTGGTASFTVANNGPTSGTAHIVVSCVGMSGTCSGSKDTSLTTGTAMSVTPSFTTGSVATTGSVTVTASYLEASSVSSSANTSVTILPPPASLAVTLDSAAQVTVGPGSRTLHYTVSNTGNDLVNVTISAGCGVFGSCTPSINGAPIVGAVPLAGATSQAVTVQLSVNAAQQGSLNVPVTVTASGSTLGGPGTGAASYSVSFPAPTPTHGVIVTANPINVTLPARTFTGNAVFIVRDTSGNVGPQTYTLTPACSGVASCSGPTTLTLADSTQQSVTIPYTVSASGTTGTVSLTAASANASGSGAQPIITTPGFSLAISPANSSQSVVKGDTANYQFTIQNTSSNSGAAQISASVTVQNCPAPTLTACLSTTGTVNIGEGSSAPGTVSFQAAQVGPAHLTVSATGTVVGGATVGAGFAADSVGVASAPPPGTIAIAPVNDNVSASAPADLTVTFTISTTEKTADSVTYHIACTGAATQCHDATGGTDRVVGPLSIGGTASVPVVVSYHLSSTIGTAGTVTLSAQGRTNPSASAIGTRTVAISNPLPLIVNTKAANAGPAIARDQCVTIAAGGDAAYECGDLRLAEELPATTTMNKSRAPTFVYNSRQGAPIAVIAANVSVGPGLGATELDATVKLISNQNHTATTGVTKVFTWTAANNSAAASRLVVPVNVSTQNLPTPLTGVYNYIFQVVAKSGSVVLATATDTGTVVVIDRTLSQFGRGWWLDGLEQLSTNTPTPTTTKLWVGGDGNARVYTKLSSTTWIVTPALDRPDTLTFQSDSSLWKRHLRNGAFTEFDNTGKHVMTQNITAASAHVAAHQTLFHYATTGASTGLLDKITLAVVSGTGPAYSFTTTRDTIGNMKTVTVTAPTKSGQTRTTTVTSNIASTRRFTILDADGSTVVFPYDATTGRITSRIDRLAHTTTFDYEANSGALAHTTDVLTTGDSTVVHSFCAGEIVGQTAISGPTEACPIGPIDTASIRTLYNGPKLGRADTVAFFINQFGGPTRIVDSTGAATTIDRLETRFPLLATRVRRSSGARTLSSDSAIYNERGLIAASTTLVDTVGTVLATTQYTWHGVFDRVARMVDAAGQTVASSYDAIGRRLADTSGVTPSTKRVTSYLYTTSDEVNSVTAPATVVGEASTTTLTYDTKGNLITSMSPLGFTTTISRDAIGQDTATKSPIDAAKTQFRFTTILRDVFGRDTLNKTVGPELSPFTQTYTATLDSMVVATVYDAEGRVTKIRRHIKPNPNKLRSSLLTTRAYDQVGRLIAETAPDGFTDSTHYADGANPTSHKDRNGAVVTTTYDALSRPRIRTAPPITDSTGFSHPAQVDTMQYDIAGRLARAANMFAVVTRSYTAAGLVNADTERVANADLTFGQHVYAVQSTYDLVGRRTSMVLPGPLETPIALYYYDEFGELDSLSSVGGTSNAGIGYHYDARGRLDTVRFANGIRDARQYDADDRLAHRVQSNSVLHNCSFTLDPRCWYPKQGSPTDSIEAVALSRNAMGQVTEVDGFLESTTSGYTGLGALAWFSRLNAQFVGPRTDQGFEVDPLGNVFHHLGRDGSEDAVTRTYDSVTARLVTTIPNDNNLSDAVDAMIARYDRAGNQATLSHVHSTTAFRPNQNQQPVPVNLVTNVSMTYDALGHLRFLHELATQQDTLIFDPSDNRTDAETRYDALGRRVWVQTQHVDTDQCGGHSFECSVQRFMWDGNTLLGEIRMPLDTLAENDFAVVSSLVNTGGVLPICGTCGEPGDTTVVLDTLTTYSWGWGAVAYLHGAGDQGIDVPAALVRVGGGEPWNGDSASRVSILFDPFVMYVHADWHGVITALSFDNGGPLLSGSVAATPPLPTDGNAEATAYGMRSSPRLTTSWVGSLTTEQQDEAGFQYRRNRYYDAATGRFTQEDPIGLAGGMNEYAFAGGDPVNFDDPFGLCPPCQGDSTRVKQRGPPPVKGATEPPDPKTPGEDFQSHDTGPREVSILYTAVNDPKPVITKSTSQGRMTVELQPGSVNFYRGVFVRPDGEKWGVQGKLLEARALGQDIRIGIFTARPDNPIPGQPKE